MPTARIHSCPRSPSTPSPGVPVGALTLPRAPRLGDPTPSSPLSSAHPDAHQTALHREIVLFLKEGKRKGNVVFPAERSHPLIPHHGGEARQAVFSTTQAALEVPRGPAPPQLSRCRALSRKTVQGWLSPCLQLSSSPAIILSLEIPFPLVTVTSQSIFRKRSAGHLLYKLSVGKKSSPGLPTAAGWSLLGCMLSHRDKYTNHHTSSPSLEKSKF